MTGLCAARLLAAGELDPRPLHALPADLQPLATALQADRFPVRIALPPRSGTHGQFDPRRLTLWISPLSLEPGIGRQTFLQEALHAVQSCPAGVVRPLGWTFPLDPAVEQGIRAILFHDHPVHRNVEREAFGLQSQPTPCRACSRRCASAARAERHARAAQPADRRRAGLRSHPLKRCGG